MNNIKKYLTSNLITAVIRVCILVAFTVCVYFGTTIKNDSDDNGNANESLTKVLRVGIKTVSNNMIFISENEVEDEPEEIDEEKQKLIDKYQAWLDMPENQLILADTFATPEEADWDKILYQAVMGGYLGTPLDVDSSELVDEYLKLTGQSELYQYDDVFVITDEEIDSFMEEKVDQICDFEPNEVEYLGDKKWFKSKGSDYWYCKGHDRKIDGDFTCVDVKENSEEIILYVKTYEYTFNDHETLSEIHLVKENDNYKVISDEINWEDGAISIFPVDLTEFDGEEYIYIYDDARVIKRDTGEPTGEYELSALVINNNKYMTSLYLNPYEDDDLGKLIAINEVMVADYNMDKESEIVITGKCENGYYIKLLKRHDRYNGIHFWDDGYLSEYISRELSEPSAQEILEYLTDGYSETGFPNYIEAFKAAARNYSAAHTHGTLEDSDAKFSLVYFNNDDVPELVAGVSGYSVTLYQFVDGYIYPIVDDWGYGAGGNGGYDYYVKAALIENFNQDGAGASYYWTYLKLNEETHQMETVLYYHGVNDTSGGWGEPGYYKCQGDNTTEIQKWEYDSLLNGYLKSSKGKDYLDGIFNYSGLIELFDNGNYGYFDYRDAYLAEVERYSKQYGDDAKFSLVNGIGGGDVPLLLAEVPGESFSLYEVEHGSSVPILEDISYDTFEGDHLEYIANHNCLRSQILNDNKGSWESYYYYINFHEKSFCPDMYISVQLDDKGEYIYSYKKYNSGTSVFEDCTKNDYYYSSAYRDLKNDDKEIIPFEGSSTAEEICEELSH